MAAAKEKTLDELLLEREAIDAEREKLSEQIQQKSSAGLVDVLNQAITMIDALQDVGLSKEAKKLIRQISRSAGIGSTPKSVTRKTSPSGGSRKEKNDEKRCVVEGFLKDRQKFTIPELDSFARSVGHDFTGNAAQYFKLQLKELAVPVGKMKNSRTIEWQKVNTAAKE